MLANIVTIIILLVIVGGAIAYIHSFRKKGSTKCIGCPSAGSCTSHGSCGSHSQAMTKPNNNTNQK